MPSLVKLRNRAQITLPKETVKKLNLKEGDNLSVEVSNGKVVITPVAIIPKDELWAWSTKIHSAIEEGKLEANEGKLKEYDTVEEIWKNMQVAED
jgi:AbrB family looped-hinge helix DNA binding protein